MNDLNTLGRAFNMEKILLTAFKCLYPFLGCVASVMELKWNFVANTGAMQFYKHIGCVIDCWSEIYLLTYLFAYHRFHVDSSSPNYIEEDDDSEKDELDSNDESDVDYEILSKIIH